MLSRENRLQKSADILNILRRGKRIHSAGLSLIYKPNGTPKIRCAFIVSRKVDPRAAKRNEIRRKLRAVLTRAAGKGLSKGLDLVVSVKGQAGNVDSQRLVMELELLIKKL